jgi:thiol-disulfide isomerase/thioredoxin
VAAVAVAGGKPFEAPPPGRLIWLSLWATWCKPCVRELPLIVRFGDELRRDGLALDNWLLSLDDDSEALAAWLASHPELRGERSWRAEQPDAIGAWAQGYGVPADASIPMNFFVNGDGLVRCVRLGAIADGDYALIKGVARALAR